MKPSTNWKNVERRIAKFLGGQRRGADFSERDGSTQGKDDVIGLPGWSVEIKHSKHANVALAVEALDQVDTVYGVVQEQAVPVAIIHKGGLNIVKQSVVCIRPAVFTKLVRTTKTKISIVPYTRKAPHWSKIVKEINKPPATDKLPVVLVSRPDTLLFYALSLPNFKKHFIDTTK